MGHVWGCRIHTFPNPVGQGFPGNPDFPFSLSIGFVEYVELEGTHQDYRVQLVALCYVTTELTECC